VNLDLTTTPFSRRGSFFALSQLAERGVFLRTVRGGARHREIARLDVGGVDVGVDATAGRLGLAGDRGDVAVAFDGPGRALLQVRSGRLELQFTATSPYDVVLPEADGVWRFVDSGANRNYRIAVEGGTADGTGDWDGVRGTWFRITVDGPALVVVDEFGSTPPTDPTPGFDDVVAAAQRDYDAWHTRHAAGTAPELAGAAELATFVTWAALVPAGGLLRRESMLMSKNGMCHVWSWDHCFNALALWRDPAAAADQLLTVFDQQDEFGALPDHVDDAGVQFNFVKPPIHGWTVDLLLDRDGLPADVVAGLYDRLARWTDWWFAHRGASPVYQHGNDSGWDNSTVFAPGVPVRSPDLTAFLVLQMGTCARLAPDPATAARWRDRAATTLRSLLEEFWVAGRFVARDGRTGAVVDSDSLLTLMPLVLGDLLPAEQFRACVQRLQRHLTPFGPATEPLDSPFYVDDGYWRGPVWAPTTLLLLDGLRRGGETALADRIAADFVATCAAGGMAENFSATTGAGLRDRSMTWTASVFLVLASPEWSTPVDRPILQE
jgi:putative isomerase